MSQSTIQNNKELSSRYIEVVWNQADQAALDDFVAPDSVRHDPATGVETGIEQLRPVVAGLHAAFHNMHFTVNAQIGDGDTVANRWTVTGTHAGEFMGIAPTGKQFTLDGISIYRFAEGKIVEEHTVWDAFGLMKQLGAIQ